MTSTLQGTGTIGELLYEAELRAVRVSDFGVDMRTVVSGAPPPAGARFDIEYTGSITGEKLNGTVSGIDYVNVRADGRTELHIHGTLVTTDGARISIYADGISIPDPATGMSLLRENVSMRTASPQYEWVNKLQAWGSGTFNPATGEIRVQGRI